MVGLYYRLLPMSHLIAIAPSLVKTAAFSDAASKLWNATRFAAKAGWNRGRATYQQNLVKRWTPFSNDRKINGWVAPTESIGSLRNKANRTFSEERRLLHHDKMREARRMYNTNKMEADKYLDDVFGPKGQSRLKDTGRWFAYNIPNAASDIPRFALMHPAQMGMGTAAIGMAFPQVFDYTVPSIAGKLAYLPSAKNDAVESAKLGALQGVEDLYSQYAGSSFGNRWKTAMNPNLINTNPNSYTKAPAGEYSWVNRLGQTVRNLGGVDEDALRNDVARNVSREFGQHLKTASVGQGIGVMKKLTNVAKGPINLYRRMPRVAKNTIGWSAAIGFPAITAVGGYVDEKMKTVNAAYDQGYNTSQNEAMNFYRKLPAWQRAIAAVSPEFAMNYAIKQRMSPNTGGQTSGNGFMGPVQTMHTTPGGSEVYR